MIFHKKSLLLRKEIMMKKVLTILIVVIVVGFTPEKTEEVEEIKALLETQRQAWNEGDLPKYMEGYWMSDSLLFIGKKGLNYGWEKTLSNYEKGYPDKAAMGNLKFELKKIEVLSPTSAYVVGKWHIDRTDDFLEGHFLLIVKKIEGQWKVVVDHSS